MHCASDVMFPLEDVRIKAFPYYDYSIEPHDHEFYEINIVLSGEGVHILNGEKTYVHRGYVFFISPGNIHEYTETSKLTVYHIVISAEIIKNNLNEAQKAPGFIHFTGESLSDSEKYDNDRFLILTENKMHYLETQLELINRFGTYGLPENSPQIYHSVWNLIYFFSYEFSKGRKCPNNKKYEQQITKILDFMHSNFEKKLSVELLSKMAFMSRSTFIRAFISVCGKTPMKYLDDYRISRAVMLLESTPMTKSEIAHKCGFYDLSHLEKKMKNSVDNG